MWALVLTVALNLQAYALFPGLDSQPVYMRTTSFRIGVGQFATKAACETYAQQSPPTYLDADGNFPLVFTQSNGVSTTFPLVPTVLGCERTG